MSEWVGGERGGEGRGGEGETGGERESERERVGKWIWVAWGCEIVGGGGGGLVARFRVGLVVVLIHHG